MSSNSALDIKSVIYVTSVCFQIFLYPDVGRGADPALSSRNE